MANSGFRVTELYAFLVVDPDGDEAVPAVRFGDVCMPLVAADEVRLRELRPLAEQAATAGGRPVQLARFEARHDMETIQP